MVHLVGLGKSFISYFNLVVTCLHVIVFFLKQRTVGEIPTVDFINNLSNSQDYKPVLTESI